MHESVRLVLTAAMACVVSACQQPDEHSIDQLPQPLTVVEATHPLLASACGNLGGTQIVHGIDHDADGYLAPYERLTVEFLCHGSLATIAATDYDRRIATLQTVERDPRDRSGIE